MSQNFFRHKTSHDPSELSVYSMPDDRRSPGCPEAPNVASPIAFAAGDQCLGNGESPILVGVCQSSNLNQFSLSCRHLLAVQNHALDMKFNGLMNQTHRLTITLGGAMHPGISGTCAL
jgi:hypothetical protein